MGIFYGADVSEYQGDIDWPAFNPGASFVVIKASEGIDYKDAKIDRNKAGVRALGADMPHMFYHFCRGNDPAQEAHWFAQCIGEILPGEGVMVDWEIDPSIDRDAWNEAFINALSQILGFRPGLWYTNQNRLVTQNWQRTAGTGIGLNVAHYGYTADENVPIRWWPFYTMHQTSSSGNFPGIRGLVDVDAFFADKITDFYAYCKPAPVAPGNSVPEPIPAPVPEPPAPVIVTPPDPTVPDPVPPVVVITPTPAPIPEPTVPPVTEHPAVYPGWYVLLVKILDFILRRHINGKSK
jgi:GH25 family lysozyme M1 (1,4-beta-N-acetylmuramidase)